MITCHCSDFSCSIYNYVDIERKRVVTLYVDKEHIYPRGGSGEYSVIWVVSFPRFVMTTGKTKELVLQELLLDDTDAVNATFLDRSTKICYYYSTSFDYRLKFANIKKRPKM